MNRRHEGNVLSIARQLEDFYIRVGLIPNAKNFGPPKVIRPLNGISCEQLVPSIEEHSVDVTEIKDSFAWLDHRRVTTVLETTDGQCVFHEI